MFFETEAEMRLVSRDGRKIKSTSEEVREFREGFEKVFVYEFDLGDEGFDTGMVVDEVELVVEKYFLGLKLYRYDEIIFVENTPINTWEDSVYMDYKLLVNELVNHFYNRVRRFFCRFMGDDV